MDDMKTLQDARRFGRRYPWKGWFASRVFTLKQGRDYDCTTHGMAQMIRNVAATKPYRLRVSLSVSDGEIEVRVVGSREDE
jgi:hypothetical protein